jgi:hypothetical protein
VKEKAVLRKGKRNENIRKFLKVNKMTDDIKRT